MTTRGMRSAPDLVRFSAHVKARREALGLTQEEVNALGGPSDTTFTKIENMEWRPGRPGTLRKLDAGLRWQEGSSARILYEGGDPIPLPHGATAAKSAAKRSSGDLAIELTVLIEITLQNVWAAVDPQSPRARQALAALDGAGQIAETLALQLTGSGEQFALQRRLVREQLRASGDRIYTAESPDPDAEYDEEVPGPEDIAAMNADAAMDD